MSCQIFSGSASSNTINLARAFKYAADNGAVILQCSWGIHPARPTDMKTPRASRPRRRGRQPARWKRRRSTTSAHNAGSPNGPIEGGIPIFSRETNTPPAAGFPGAAEYCISVNSIAGDYTISTFSNYGTFSDIAALGGDQDYYFDYVDIREDGEKDPSAPEYTAARGAVGCVLSTLPPQVSDDTCYGYMEGTSMACPPFRVWPPWDSRMPPSCASTSRLPNSAN